MHWVADAGYFLAMVTEGQVHVLNEGQSVVLECSFHADGYSLFSYPVLWRKQQLDEDVQMNIMGNINEPFAATNRFEVAFTSLAPRYKFELSVGGLFIHRFTLQRVKRFHVFVLYESAFLAFSVFLNVSRYKRLQQ